MARWVLAGIVLPSVVLLGFAESRRQFFNVEGRAPDGSALTLRAAPELRRTVSTLEVSVQDKGRRVQLVLPRGGTTADHLEGQLLVVDAGGSRSGRAVFEVEEAGTFLAGRIRGSAGDLEVSGGLRVRRRE